MKYLILIICFFQNTLQAQDYYFPPNDNDEWETIEPTDLSWCTENIDNLYHFLEEKNTKAFIILKDGKIVIEKYFDSFTKDSVWYWASAGKSLTAFLVGIAQDEGLLEIEDATADYLGSGWTSTTPEQEEAIKIRHQLTMTTGLDDDVADMNCLESECLNFLIAPQERWFYYNAPYRLVQDVVASASGLTFNQYTFSRLNSITGITGLWLDYVFYSNPRQAARFGSLILNQGTWNNQSVLNDQFYFHDMVNTSQELNPSYGYLWWLNGKGSYRLPQSEIIFNTNLIPNAPDDLIAALGKNDQKIYVVPSQNLVVIRMGNSAGESPLALSSFDNQLWEKLNELSCNPTAETDILIDSEITIYPNPIINKLYFTAKKKVVTKISIYNTFGNKVFEVSNPSNSLDISYLPNGIYCIEMTDSTGAILTIQKVVKQ